MATPTITLHDFFTGTLGATLGTVYTVPLLTKAMVYSATFCNPTAAPVLLSLRLMPRGGATAHTVLSAWPIAAGETYLGYELLNKILEAGGLLEASGLGLEVDIGGIQIVNG